MKDLVWVTMNLDDGNRIAYAGNSRATARRVAEALVNNRAGADTGEIVLYGPGNGDTTVMVRQLPKSCLGPPAETACLTACRAVLASISQGEDGYWRGGPWADPSAEEGAGGVVELLREATDFTAE
jgi:hypothetical protein